MAIHRLSHRNTSLIDLIFFDPSSYCKQKQKRSGVFEIFCCQSSFKNQNECELDAYEPKAFPQWTNGETSYGEIEVGPRIQGISRLRGRIHEPPIR